jgi:hypothetical protein
MPILGILASAGAVRNSYESIATVSVGGGGAASASFTLIPSTYKHLQIRFLARDDKAGQDNNFFKIAFNSDSGSNYARHNLLGNGSTATADYGTSTTAMVGYSITSATAASSIFGAGIVDILDYTNTSKYKTVRSLAGFDLNGSGKVALNSGLWMNTAAITQIDFTGSTANLAQYSQIALYGIKG